MTGRDGRTYVDQGDAADWFQRMTTDRWGLQLAIDKRRRIAARLAEVRLHTLMWMPIRWVP